MGSQSNPRRDLLDVFKLFQQEAGFLFLRLCFLFGLCISRGKQKGFLEKKQPLPFRSSAPPSLTLFFCGMQEHHSEQPTPAKSISPSLQSPRDTGGVPGAVPHCEVFPHNCPGAGCCPGWSQAGLRHLPELLCPQEQAYRV